MQIFTRSPKNLPLMSISVTLPGFGSFDFTGGTAGDVVRRAQQLWPTALWHGNQLVSCGRHQLKHDDLVHLGPLVLANYSELSQEEQGRQGPGVGRGALLCSNLVRQETCLLT